MINNKIKALTNALSNATTQVNENLAVIYSTINGIEAKFIQLSKTLSYAYNASSDISLAAYKLGSLFEEAREYLRRYEVGLLDLLNGKIPATLISPEEFRKTLLKMEDGLQKSDPHYRLLFRSMSHFFRKEDIQFSIVEDHIVVSVPVYLVKVNQEPLTLYKIETCYITYQISDSNSDATGSHTKVKFDHDYIAVKGDNFIEMSVAELKHCKQVDRLYLCEDHLVQLSLHALTCSSAIFYGSSVEVTKNHSEFSYIHRIDPPPCILESETHILLSSIGDR